MADLTLNQEAGLPENWHPIDARPIVPGQSNASPPLPNEMANYFSGSISPTMQHDAVFVGTQYGSPNVPSVSLMPIAAAGVPAVGSAIQSGSRVSINETTSIIAAGMSGQIQFNNNGPLGASSALTWDNINDIFTVGGSAVVNGDVSVSGSILITGGITADTFNALTGFQVGGAAAIGKYLRGNGTDFVSATLSGSDVAAGMVGVTYGGTGANLSATGGTSEVLRQSTAGGAVTVSQLAFADISGSASSGQIPNLDASKITTGQLALARGGTNADLSATGGTSQVLKQTTPGGPVTVSQLAASDLSNGTTGTTNVVLSVSPTVTTPKWTAFVVASLPTGAEGQYAYASNGRKVGEGSGSGTGVPVYFSNSQWRVFSTDAQVLA